MDFKSIYIYSHGNLEIKEDKLHLENETKVDKISLDNIKAINILGEVSINKSFLRLISKKKITIHFYNYHGYYSGSFFPPVHHNAANVLIEQARLYLDFNERLKIAKIFVEGAVYNILQIIRYYKNRGRDIEEYEIGILSLINLIKECENINTLMAIEGNARNYYYKAFDKILKNPDFQFEQRSRRPPLNYLNTLISFGNTILYTTVLSIIYYSRLDPRIGFLHTSNFRRFSLNLDIAEIFKPIVVDRVIFTLVNRNIITKKDFEFLSEGVILKEKGKETFITYLEDKLNASIKYEDGEHITYRNLIKNEVKKIEDYLLEKKEIKPFITKW